MNVEVVGGRRPCTGGGGQQRRRGLFEFGRFASFKVKAKSEARQNEEFELVLSNPIPQPGLAESLSIFVSFFQLFYFVVQPRQI